MARIKLDIPAGKLATITVPIRISDINYGNHVGNDAFVSIIHEARMQWLKQHDFTELQAGGAGLIMSDLALEFKRESFYGDIVTVELYAGEISRFGFELYYRLSATRKEADVLLANAKTGMVCYDYTMAKVISIPDGLLAILHTQEA